MAAKPARFAQMGHGQWCPQLSGARLVVMLLFALCSTYMLLFQYPGPDISEGFVTVNGMHLELQCRPFYVVGFNTHDLLQNAMITPNAFSTPDSLAGDQMVKALMSRAADAGLNVARTWSHTNHPRFPCQESPGGYNDKALSALDLVVENARRRGIRLILGLVDNWKYYNGVDQYVDWSPTVPKRTQQRPVDSEGDPTPLMYQNESIKGYEAQRHTLFYTNKQVKAFFKAHIDKVLNRVNSYSRKTYKDDETIMAWNLLNEPRCESWRDAECDSKLHAWIDEMGTYVKMKAPRQLVMIGSEGFFSSDSPQVHNNPQPWAQQMGQNFTGNNRIPAIDMAGMHVWPNNWERTSDEFLTQWIDSHVNETEVRVQKPLLLEEFGKKIAPAELTAGTIRSLRDHVYTLTYANVERHIERGSPLVGSMYWRWDLQMFNGDKPGEYGVNPKHSTFKIIQEHARYIQNKINSVPPRPSCGFACWVPATRWGFRTCVQDQSACAQYWSAHAIGSPLPAGLYFTSKHACCRAGLGAYVEGCA